MKTFQTNSASTSFNILEDEATVIHTGTSNYYSLNKTGTYIWNLIINKSYSLDDLAKIISADYKQDMVIIQSHLAPFLNNLVEADLIVAHTASLNTEEVEKENLTNNKPQEYEQPDMVHFGNLETLILSGE